MRPRPEDLLFLDEGSPEQAEALRQALAADPELARALAQWDQLRAGVRSSLDARLPDRSSLVLYALAGTEPSLLTAAEHEALAAARPALEAALRAHPALADVVRQIQAAAAAFDAAWEAAFEEAGEASGEASDETVPALGARRMPDRQPALRRRSGMRWVARGAIGLAVVAFAVVAVLLGQRDSSLVTVRTAEGEVRVVQLGDGSIVRLLGSSVFSFVDPARRAAFDRHARLVGRAFFEIAPAQEGFVVETPTARATVLGTRFGVVADDALTEVVLAAGRLSLAPSASPRHVVVLAPGQASRVAAGALPSTPAPVDVAEVLDWTGLFVFEATPLGQIVERLRAHFDQAVAVDPALAEEAVTGTFEQSQPLAEILEVIAATLGAELRPEAAGGYRIVPAS